MSTAARPAGPDAGLLPTGHHEVGPGATERGAPDPRARTRRRRHSPAQIVAALRHADELLAQGDPIATVASAVGISEATFHRWRTHYGGIKADDAQRLRELADENRDLRRQVADQCLDILMLRQVLSGAMLPPAIRVHLVAALRDRFGVSERRACEVIGASRSSQRRLADPLADPLANPQSPDSGRNGSTVTDNGDRDGDGDGDFTHAFAGLDPGDRVRLGHLIGTAVDHLTVGPRTGVPA